MKEISTDPDLCWSLWLGTVEYAEAWELQRRLVREVSQGRLPNLLLLLEHPHVYTIGRRGKREEVLLTPERLDALGVKVYEVDRGGQVTYHGPGQLVGYPIIDLRRWGGGPVRYVQTLEEAIVATLSDLGVRAHSHDKPTGVWVGDAKIAAIGARVTRGVTMHGFALNICPDLEYFRHIVPCGMPECPVTSASEETGRSVAVHEAAAAFTRHFSRLFGFRTVAKTLDAVLATAGRP